MKKGTLVTRISHGHDVIFRVVEINKDKAILRGEVLRLVADSPLNDLKEYEVKNKIILSLPSLDSNTKLLKGKILHLDGDRKYMEKSIKYYKQLGLNAIVRNIPESKQPMEIKKLLDKYKPDILVITGHDSYAKDKDKFSLESYRNTKYFVECVKIARSMIMSKDELVIVAGACQSYYEKLIEEGANFASSPKRKNIHLLDPVIVASSIATTTISQDIDFNKILQSTYSKQIGGIETKGKARKYFLGGS